MGVSALEGDTVGAGLGLMEGEPVASPLAVAASEAEGEPEEDTLGEPDADGGGEAEDEKVPSAPEALGLPLGDADRSELEVWDSVGALLSLAEGESLGVGAVDKEGVGEVVEEEDGGTLTEAEAHGEPDNDTRGLSEALNVPSSLADTEPLPLAEGEPDIELLGDPLLVGADDPLAPSDASAVMVTVKDPEGLELALPDSRPLGDTDPLALSDGAPDME